MNKLAEYNLTDLDPNANPDADLDADTEPYAGWSICCWLFISICCGLLNLGVHSLKKMKSINILLLFDRWRIQIYEYESPFVVAWVNPSVLPWV